MDIRRTRDDPQPYVIYGRETIEQSTASSLQSFLRDRLPMNTTGLPNGQLVSTLGNQSNFNLRGLGANQTLILINGHRASPGPSYGSAPRQSDINSIPMSAVERIEVLPATASGIYGGSATGGVINIILRHDYAGSEVKATYGNSFESDVAQRRIDLSTGFNLEGGKTHVLVIGSFSDQNQLTLQERPDLAERYYSTALQNAPTQVLPSARPPLGSTPNIRSANGSNLVLKTGQALNLSSHSFRKATQEHQATRAPRCSRMRADTTSISRIACRASREAPPRSSRRRALLLCERRSIANSPRTRRHFWKAATPSPRPSPRERCPTAAARVPIGWLHRHRTTRLRATSSSPCRQAVSPASWHRASRRRARWVASSCRCREIGKRRWTTPGRAYATISMPRCPSLAAGM